MKSSVNLFDFTKLNLTTNQYNEFEIKAHYSLMKVSQQRVQKCEIINYNSYLIRFQSYQRIFIYKCMI